MGCYMLSKNSLALQTQGTNSHKATREKTEILFCSSKAINLNFKISWCWENWTSTYRRMALENSEKPYFEERFKIG